VHNSAGLTAYYHKDLDTTATAISLVTMTVGTFTSSGFKEIDSTNMPGWYQFCPPDAAFSTGTNVGFHLKGATNMAPLPIEVQLVSYNPEDGVRLGLTALPNAAAGASSGLPLSVDASGRVDVLKINGTSQTARDIGASVLLDGDFTATMKTSLNAATPASVTGSVGSVTGNVGGNVVGTVASVVTKTGYALTSGEHTLIVADVNAALDTAGTELSAIPSETGTLRQKISAVWQYLMMKRTTTTSVETMYKADNSTSLATASISDNGTTATHGKVS
jgi:hypothetical protein